VVVPGRFVAIKHPDSTFVPSYYVTAATPSTIAQFEATVGAVVLYSPQLFGIQFAVATSHGKILNLSRRLSLVSWVVSYRLKISAE
jgi:hypothetical protein